MSKTEAQFRNDLVKTGIAQVGRDYRDSAVPTNWPPQQFDCSTFTHWLMAMNGINLDAGGLSMAAWPPREPSPWHKYQGYTLTQQNAAKMHKDSIIPFDLIKPGDFLYYDKPGQHHVIMYIGGGKAVHAAGTAYGVIISPVVGPGVSAFGGKTLTMCVSSTRFARASGYKFAAVPVPTKPPVPKPRPTPIKKPTVFLSHILSAVRHDGPAAQGHTTFKSEVFLVEHALVVEKLLPVAMADGSAGTVSFGPRSAYQAWQKRCGYSGNAADGYPGKESLTRLGKKYGFNVV